MNEQPVEVELKLEELLRHMVERAASDLHLTVGVPPLLRIDGRLNRTENNSLTGEDTQLLAYSVLGQQEIEFFQQAKSLDKSLSIEGLGRFRISLYQERGNIAAAIRLIPDRIPSFMELGLPQPARNDRTILLLSFRGTKRRAPSLLRNVLKVAQLSIGD